MASPLLLGASGFLGYELKRALACDTAGRDLIDLTKPLGAGLVGYLKKYTHVILAAAVTDVEQCFRDIRLSHQVNVTGTLELLALIKEAGATPVFFSSDYVFAPGETPRRESDERRPETIYGRQKLAAEHYIQQHFRRHLIFRTSKLMAKRLYPRNILSPVLRSLKAGKPVPCFTDQWLNPVFVEDVARVVEAALALGLSGTFHLGTRRVFTRYELGRFLAERLGFDPDLIQPARLASLPLSEKRPPHNTLACGPVEAVLGFRFTELEDALPDLRAALNSPHE